MRETRATFDPIAMLRVLVAHRVDFILIGGLAAAAHGSPYATVDVDIVPRRQRDNLERLSAALEEMGAEVYVSADESHRFAHDGRSLADATVWNLSTSYGGLDLSFVPAGTSGYADLVRRARDTDLGGVTVRVAALDDIIRSKETAGREKDNVVLPALRRLLDMQERPGRSSG